VASPVELAVLIRSAISHGEGPVKKTEAFICNSRIQVYGSSGIVNEWVDCRDPVAAEIRVVPKEEASRFLGTHPQMEAGARAELVAYN
jgi:hypothetical protein